MKPLVDADVLLYEIGVAAEYKRESIPGWDYVQEMVDLRITQICEAVGATQPPILFISGKENFRNDIAIKKGYKANRKDSKKPFHYTNLKAYFQFAYNCVVTDGIEADDAMGIEAMKDPDGSVICSRDKDLRMIPCFHYSWECGKQAEISLYKVDLMGEFWTKKLPKELKGTGLRFFYAQCLMGDTVDNIPGLPGYGPKKTYELLESCGSPQELEGCVINAYRDHYNDRAIEELTEQAQLLWILRETNEDGTLKHFQLSIGD
jgi:5'-3' exonuclease